MINKIVRKFVFFTLNFSCFHILPLFAAAAIGGIAKSVAPAVINYFSQKYATDKTNETNKDIANENLNYQRENFDYNKALQERIFQREDSAYQRTINDMRQAGLSPLVMTGTNSAGEAIATSPLNNQFTSQREPSLDVSRVFDNMSTLLSLQYQGEQVKNAKLQNKFLDDTIDSRVDAEKIKTRIAQAESMIKSYEESDRLQKNLYNKFFGINDSMTPDERNAAIINRLFKFDDYSEFDKNNFDQGYINHSKSYSKVYSGLRAGGSILDLLKGIM